MKSRKIAVGTVVLVMRLAGCGLGSKAFLKLRIIQSEGKWFVHGLSCNTDLKYFPASK